MKKQLVLTIEMLELCPEDSFLSRIIYGKTNIGKSSYALQSAMQFFHYKFDLSENKAWEKALECIKFTPKLAIDWWEQHSFDNRAPITILDDATSFFRGDLYNEDRKMYNKIIKMFNVIRTRTDALIITCPDPEPLMGAIDGLGANLMKISRDNGWNRYMTEYKKETRLKYTKASKGLGSFHTGYRDIGVHQSFSCRMPNKWFNKYIKIRDSYVEKVNNGDDEDARDE